MFISSNLRGTALFFVEPQSHKEAFFVCTFIKYLFHLVFCSYFSQVSRLLDLFVAYEKDPAVKLIIVKVCLADLVYWKVKAVILAMGM